MRIIQVAVSGTRAQLTTQTLYASVIVGSASAASSFIGDNTVTTSNGQILPTGTATPLVILATTPRGIPLNSLYVIGTSGNANFLYEPAQ
jgi:hypothetical protein